MAKKADKQAKRSGQFLLRLPDHLREKIAAIATEQERSMTDVVIEALTLNLDQVGEAERQLAELWAKVENLEKTVRSHDDLLRNRIPYDD